MVFTPKYIFTYNVKEFPEIKKTTFHVNVDMVNMFWWVKSLTAGIHHSNPQNLRVKWCG